MRLPVNQEGFSDKLGDYRDWQCERTGRGEAAASRLMYVRDQIMRVAGHGTGIAGVTTVSRIFDDTIVGKIASIGTSKPG
jgi:hypothetical protein